MKDEKAEVYIRVLDDNHRVCIPIQVRQEMEVSPGCSIEFLADGDRIILRKYGQEVSSIVQYQESIFESYCTALI